RGVRQRLARAMLRRAAQPAAHQSDRRPRVAARRGGYLAETSDRSGRRRWLAPARQGPLRLRVERVLLLDLERVLEHRVRQSRPGAGRALQRYATRPAVAWMTAVAKSIRLQSPACPAALSRLVTSPHRTRTARAA